MTDTAPQLDEIDSPAYVSTQHNIRNHARSFVNYYNTEQWVNEHILMPLGIENLGSRSRVEYRINIAIKGNYGRRVTACSRKEALAEFFQHLQKTLEKGKITADGSYDNVYRVELVDGAEPVFYAGPEDPEDIAVNRPPTVADLEARFREVVLAARLRDDNKVSRSQYDHALTALNLEPLPQEQTFQLEIPITGVTTVAVRAYDEDGARAAAAGILTGSVVVKPETTGPATLKTVAGTADTSTPDEDPEDEDAEEDDVY